MINYKANTQRGFMGVLIGVILIAACALGLYYLVFYKKVTYIAPETLQDISTTQTATENIDDEKVTYVSTITAQFEGTYRTAFQFSYPKNLFKVTATQDGKKITISEIKPTASTTTSTGTTTASTTPTTTSAPSAATSTVHTITVSFEGEREYTPEEYWTAIGKKTCSDCIKNRAPFEVPDSDGSLTYENNKKIIHIVKSQKDTPWLFVFEIQKPATPLIQALKTFSFK
jgi:hypothetical protein